MEIAKQDANAMCNAMHLGTRGKDALEQTCTTCRVKGGDDGGWGLPIGDGNVICDC